MKQYYRPDEVAEIFGINRRTVYRLLNKRKIRGIKIGASIRISHEEIERIKKKRKGSSE